jgi:hypothetical protein
MKVTFTVFTKREGTKHVYDPVIVVKVAPTFEEALKQLSESHPHHTIAKHLGGLYKIEEE